MSYIKPTYLHSTFDECILCGTPNTEMKHYSDGARVLHCKNPHCYKEEVPKPRVTSIRLKFKKQI